MKQSFNQIISSEKPVLVDFYLPTCLPCDKMTLILDAVQKSLGSRIRVLKLDINQYKNLVADYKIQYVPTLMLFQNGKKLWQQSGQASAPEILGEIIEKSN